MTVVGTAVLLVSARALEGQANYEIQVYPSETVSPGTAMLELHSNFTSVGQEQTVNGVAPTSHALHETLEFTYGFTSWFETAFYVFTSARSTTGWQWVGDHLRPRVRAPESWNWPLGVSISTEFGYQRRAYSEDTWTWEIRPIVDKRAGRWYVSLNPALEKSVQAPAPAAASSSRRAPRSATTARRRSCWAWSTTAPSVLSPVSTRNGSSSTRSSRRST